MAEALHLNQFQLDFSTRVELLLQEKGSKLRGAVTVGVHTGARGASPVNQVSSTTVASPAGRFAPLNRTDMLHERRWVTPVDYDIMSQLDNFDMLKYMSDFKGPYAENHALAMGRAMDDAILAAMAGTAAIGETGTGSEAFDTNYRVAANYGASGDVGLTVAKLIKLRQMFKEANVDERPTLVITPRQEAELLSAVETTSLDFSARPRLEDGEIKSFMGVDFIVSNRTQSADVPFGLTSSDRRCPAFVRSGVHLGIWKEPASRVDERKDLSSIPWQIYTMGSWGVTRLEQGKVIEVLCSEA